MGRQLADTDRVEETHVLADDCLEILPAQPTHDPFAGPVEADGADVHEDELGDGEVDIVERKSIGAGAKFRFRYGSIGETGESSSKLAKDDLYVFVLVSFFFLVLLCPQRQKIEKIAWGRTDDYERVCSSCYKARQRTQHNDESVPSCSIRQQTQFRLSVSSLKSM